jgi:Gpi18-like mannosyltransferase
MISKQKNFSKLIVLGNWLSTSKDNIGWVEAVYILFGLIFAIIIRLYLINYKTLDYFASLKPWYNTISTMGFSAFSTNFSTYNPPYLYLLFIISRLFPNLPIVIAVKLPSLIADFICSYLIFLIARIKFKGIVIPLVAGLAVLFIPTVILNSAFWGQADSLFTAGILACIYFLISKKNGPALFFWGVALAVKLQAIFLAPLLLALFLRKNISWKYFLMVPLILILALIPAWLAGRPLMELLDIYIYQASQFQLLTMNAASIYTWLPTTNQVFNLFYWPGVWAGVSTAFLLMIIVYRSPSPLSNPLILELTLVANLVIPFFLPKMHERYFFPADIISIPFAFYYPQFFYIPILVEGVSFFSYQPFLYNSALVPLPILTLIQLITIIILLYHILFQLYSPNIDFGRNISSDKGSIENAV